MVIMRSFLLRVFTGMVTGAAVWDYYILQEYRGANESLTEKLLAVRVKAAKASH